jgi:hypothetical protein
MKYVNREMKIDQIVGYFNQHKINLIPPFQRGTVWNLATRQRLIVNMIQARPIPAVFLYKQADGAQFAYNILDGKQRLETLILFIGNKRNDLKVDNVEDYFFGKLAKRDANFAIELNGEEINFERVDQGLVRALREYAIPTIEIDMDDENTSIDEIINLFIDINQQGVKVSRFEVVKALGKDPLFKQVFDLIAQKETRKKKSMYYKAKNKTSFVFVMKRLKLIDRLTDRNSKVDRMWEKLTEVTLFSRFGKHRAPADILKSFIKAGHELNARLTKAELAKLRSTFDFLAMAYRMDNELMVSKIATDQPQFYTLITTLLSSDLMRTVILKELAQRIAVVGAVIDGRVRTPAKLKAVMEEYVDLATKQTTHPGRRDRRQEIFVEAIKAVEVKHT